MYIYIYAICLINMFRKRPDHILLTCYFPFFSFSPSSCATKTIKKTSTTMKVEAIELRSETKKST